MAAGSHDRNGSALVKIPGGQPLVLGSWFAIILLATVRQVTSPTPGLPSPSVYVGSSVLFTMFYAGASFPGLAPLFGVLSVGVVLAALMKPYINSTGATIANSGPIYQLSTLLDSMSGTTKTTGG
jgi:hypothetical protein